MLSEHLNELPQRAAIGARRLALGTTFVVAMLGTSAAQAFLSLDLTPKNPDIETPGLNVSWTDDLMGPGGTLKALGTSGFFSTADMSQLKLESGNKDITDATFELMAIFTDPTSAPTSGSLTIGGTIPDKFFTSGTLLTGELESFGTGSPGGDPLEFLFRVTGGDAAALFGDEAGVILSGTGFNGNLAALMPMMGQSVADTYSTVPEPGTMWLLMLAGFVVHARRARGVRGTG